MTDKRIIEVLRYYANREIYQGANMDSFSDAECDAGTRARELLVELGEPLEEPTLATVTMCGVIST